MDGQVARAVSLNPQPDWVPRLKIHVDDYHRMAEAGILSHDDRVELIEGELIAVSPFATPHMMRVIVMNRLLVGACADRALLSVQMSVRLGEYSEPEPDFALLSPDWAQAPKAPPKPEHVFLVVEVSDSTLRYDRTVKAELYARYGVAEYWIVNVVAGEVIVHRGPSADGYRNVRVAAADEVLELVALPGLRLAVADILA
jgi:Uma2 family endonuclease